MRTLDMKVEKAEQYHHSTSLHFVGMIKLMQQKRFKAYKTT